MRRQRADAERNRERVLAAAADLFRSREPATVTMEDIAAAAGVGKATLYRHFRDRATIAVALLDEHEQRLQEQMIRGTPPLGPGAPPAQRLAAFYGAMVELLEQHAHLVLGTEVGYSRFTTGAYRFWRTHVLSLLRESGTADPDATVELLLAPVAPEVFRHQRDELGLSTDAIRAALTTIADRQLNPAPTSPSPVVNDL